VVSPATILLDNLQGAVENIAPERKQDLKKLYAEEPISFKFVYESEFKVTINTDSRIISIDISSLELLWIASYMFRTLYNDFCTAQRKKESDFDSRNYPRSAQAVTLYNWAQKKIREKNFSFWPKRFPIPAKSSNQQSEEFINNQMFYSAMAWILHHEIAHSRLNHPNLTTQSMSEEKAADMAATEWIFGKCPQKDKILTFRGLGLTAALLSLLSIDFEEGSFNSQTHPQSFLRLYNCISSLPFEEDHLLYAFIVTVINMFMATKGVEYEPNYDGQTFKRHFEEYCIALQKHATGR